MAFGSSTDAYTYDPDFGELASYSAVHAGNDLYAATYTRDALGRITRKIETVEGASDTYDYTYDLAGRLTDVERNATQIAHYDYDANGNRIAWIDPWGSGTATHDDQDRLLAYGTTTYTYTLNGELATKTSSSQTVTYNYDVAGNLRQVVLPDGVTVDYVIDAANRRVGKKVDGTLVEGFLYKDQLNPVAQLDGAGIIQRFFVYGSKANVPDYIEEPATGQVYRVISDQLGSVRLVVDNASGEIVQRLDYDTFGRVMLNTNPGFQPFGFAGGLFDHQTGLVRFGARDYDAETGRWLAKDSIGFAGGDANLYNYALADPVNFVDPLGESVWTFTKGFARGFVTGVVVGVVAAAAVVAAPVAAPLVAVAGAIGAATIYYEGVALHADPCVTADQRHEFWGGVAGGLTGATVGGYGFARGRELTFGKNVRVAPFGNRTGHPQGRWPHYHRRSVGPTGQPVDGQGLNRHRPWETKSPDTSIWDRF